MSQARVSVGIPPELIPRGWLDAVGFVRTGGVLHVAFPKVYDAHLNSLACDGSYLTGQLVLLVRVLARYSADVRLQAATPSALGEGSTSLLDWLEAAVELYDDYLLNGLYWVKRATISRRTSTSPIHWGTTLRSAQAHLQDEVPLYLEPYRRSLIRTTDDLLHRLHATLLDEIGILLTGRSIVEGGQSLSQAELDVARADPDGFLQGTERNLFADRPKRLVRLIHRYLQVTSEGAGSIDGLSVLCRSENFELIWEHMLRAAIENRGGRAAKGLPAGEWNSASAGQAKGINARVDFAYEGSDDEGRYIAFFDAKDRAALQSRTGSGPDHYKQIMYALLSKESRVLNVLVFPTIEPGRGPVFKLTGWHEWADLPRSRVFEASADYVRVSNAFVNCWAIDPSELLGAVAQHGS